MKNYTEYINRSIIDKINLDKPDDRNRSANSISASSLGLTDEEYTVIYGNYLMILWDDFLRVNPNPNAVEALSTLLNYVNNVDEFKILCDSVPPTLLKAVRANLVVSSMNEKQKNKLYQSATVSKQIGDNVSLAIYPMLKSISPYIVADMVSDDEIKPLRGIVDSSHSLDELGVGNQEKGAYLRKKKETLKGQVIEPSDWNKSSSINCTMEQICRMAYFETGIQDPYIKYIYSNRRKKERNKPSNFDRGKTFNRLLNISTDYLRENRGNSYSIKL